MTYHAEHGDQFTRRDGYDVAIVKCYFLLFVGSFSFDNTYSIEWD